MATAEKIKNELQKNAANPAKKEMPKTIQGWVKAYEGQIAKALPSVLTPERFSRMVLTALSKTPKLAECTPASFVGSMLTAAQLGLEPNTPLGQAYLIPYKNECQFQIGYKGLLDLAYRSGEFKCIYAEMVYENDEFDFQLGLDAELKHKPALKERGKATWVYAVYKLKNDGYSFKVMSVDEVIAYANKYSKTFKNGPWQTDFEAMAKKTVLKQLLKYAPLKTEFARGIATDEKTAVIEIDTNNSDETPIITTTDFDVSEDEVYDVDVETGEIKDNFVGTPFENK